MRTKLLTKIATFAFMANSALAVGNGWMTDFEAAKKKAAAENKDLLIEFTGSDWCPPCKALNKAVFSKEEFVKAASEKFVLVGLDYPRKKQLPAALTAQNAKLIGTYSVNSFPTVLLCDSKGMPYAAQGYLPGGPVDYMKGLNELTPAKAKRDADLVAANKLEGKAKADALWAVINGLEVPVGISFDPVFKSILAADATDEGGKIAMMYISSELAALTKGDDTAPAFKKLDDYIAKNKVAGEAKQELLTKKLDVLFGQKDFAGMKKIIDVIIAVAPESRIGKGIAQAKPRIDMMERQYKEEQAAKKAEAAEKKAPATK